MGDAAEETGDAVEQKAREATGNEKTTGEVIEDKMDAAGENIEEAYDASADYVEDKGEAVKDAAVESKESMERAVEE